MFITSKLLETKNYVEIYNPEHPDARANGYIREHRLVMTKQIGRRLKGYEVIHHLNKVKNDNRPENLVLCKNQVEHLMKYHPKLYAKYCDAIMTENIRIELRPCSKDERFQRYLNLYQSEIQDICNKFVKRRVNNRVDYDDLYQESMLCLLELAEKNRFFTLGYVCKAVKFALVDYIRKYVDTNTINMGTEDLNLSYF